MKYVQNETLATWQSGDYVGKNRPMMRATIQMLNMQVFAYDLAKVPFSQRKGTGKFTSAIFGQAHQPVELPNIKSIRWSRSVNQDVATCTIVLYNSAPLPLGQAPVDDYTLDMPGYYTAMRGETGNRWGQVKNGWRDLIVPDRLIRTYEGYGFDPEVVPEDDPDQYPSGVWLIDDVSYSATGHLITVECRDVGRVLLDQIMFPPVIPFPQYPLTWDKYHTITVPKTTKVSGSGWRRPKYNTDSNIPYIGSGITDGGLQYVSSSGTVYGHHGRDAFDTSTSSYWLSVGNRQKWSSAYEYVQGSVTGTVGAVRVHAWGGPYRMWISVFSGGKWQGAHKIPYRSRVVDTEADIPYVHVVTIGKDEDLTVKLPRSYASATMVRITFSRLYNSGLGRSYKYRAGVRDFEVATSGTVTTNTNVTVGNYDDYSDIVKWLCAWGGFYWPLGQTNQAYLTQTDGTKVTVAPGTTDGTAGFPAGRVWGDFELTGTANALGSPLGIEIWDKKPLMDGINYVKEIVGYNFFIDENGGVVWRSPNIFKKGNWVSGVGGNAGYTAGIVTIDERQTLLDLTPKMSSRNVRERIFVANISGRYAGMSQGYNPYPSGLRRVGGWTDQKFTSTTECQVMADMITMRQAQRYRTNTITITGYPAIQVDDQVRIYERITGEQWIHYVIGISSEWDLESGKWTYTLDTQWLGEAPGTRWLVDNLALHQEAIDYLNNMSSQPGLTGGF